MPEYEVDVFDQVEVSVERSWGKGRIVKLYPDSGEVLVEWHDESKSCRSTGESRKKRQKLPVNNVTLLQRES